MEYRDIKIGKKYLTPFGGDYSVVRCVGKTETKVILYNMGLFKKEVHPDHVEEYIPMWKLILMGWGFYDLWVIQFIKRLFKKY